VELRRNAMPVVLPLIALVFWFDSYRIAATLPPLWAERLFYIFGQGHSLLDFAPFVAGVAAWMGSRDGRRGLTDLLATGARPRFAVQFATWAATTIWAVGGYLVFMAATLWALSRSITYGAPPYWPLAVGAVGVAAFSAAGFAAGAFFPTRFTAPVAAFGALLACGISSQIGFNEGTGWALILPTNSNNNFGQDAGVFYQFLPDLPIARVMFLGGLAVVAIGVLGLPARAGSGRLRAAAALVTLAGVAAAGTASVLVRTARLTPQGIAIPALHDAANDRPIGYTPVCAQAAGVPVCLNPAYRRYLAEIAADLRPVLAEVAGLPGAPIRVAQVAGRYASGMFEDQDGVTVTISGTPPVLRLPLDVFNTLPSATPGSTGQFDQEMALLSVHEFVAGNGVGTAAQQAVQAALLQHAGMPFAAQPQALEIFGLPNWAGADLQGLVVGSESAAGPGSPRGPVYAAARRFAALPSATRHAWLAAHLAALRSGQLTLGQLP
jgi:hypothetical protein